LAHFSAKRVELLAMVACWFRLSKKLLKVAAIWSELVSSLPSLPARRATPDGFAGNAPPFRPGQADPKLMVAPWHVVNLTRK
jgi:hypothetical protein